jgi:hypothetical protein
MTVDQLLVYAKNTMDLLGLTPFLYAVLVMVLVGAAVRFFQNR